MITIIGLVIAVVWLLMELIYRYQGEIIIVPIKGLMLGGLYNSEEIQGMTTEHTIQILFFVFSFNIIWVTD